ncbi:hypothetical protein Cgig2_021398 [Carnegiea gigantea]|uniref:Uncharacterized protein n=1 Tax=Carnegiea gigantea TaxID=171969 RepID=A0A9Q1GSY4_9CARY|nr:hypothetical protein Cgig2_021398 [Carnegiea gigantea]
MTCNKLLFLIERLDYEQWIAIMETSFGGFLSVRTLTIPKDLATWLLQKFDSASNTLKLSNNRVVKITEGDVHTTLALPIGQLEIQRIKWNLGRIGSLKVGKMVDQILQRGDRGDEFKRDFVLYIISTCIIGNMSGDCFFRILKSLVDVNQIVKYNWCAFLLQYLNDTVVEWKQNCTRYFRGPLLFLMTTDAVEQRNEDEKEFPREYGRGKTIDRIDHQSIISEGETDLHKEFASVARENQKHTDLAASTHDRLPAPQPPCSECGSEREPQIAGPNDLIEDEHFFNDPEFFGAYLKMKVVVLKHYQRQTLIGYTLSTFNLGIPLSLEQRIHTVISSPIKRTHTISSSHIYNDEQVSR